MRSPFPGMDPYLEQYWGDIHHSLITYLREAIQPGLPGGLLARVDERVFVESSGTSGAKHRPRMCGSSSAVARGSGPPDVQRHRGGRALGRPLRAGRAGTAGLHRDHRHQVGQAGRLGDRDPQSFEQARRSREGLYVKKQEELRAGRVSLVEIDLLRTGSRVLSVPLDRIPEGHRTAYAACVRRGWKPFEIEFYRIPLRERLPAIAIPLRRDDRDVPLDLQAVLDRCYEVGCYGDDIDYREEPDPPLQPDDARWADALLREKGLRG